MTSNTPYPGPSPKAEPEQRQAEQEPHEEASTSRPDLLELAPSPGAALVGNAPMVGRCIEERHPTLQGRVRVAIGDACGETTECWLPKLQGLAVREGDQVLLTKPSNWSEAVVVGVLDGFASRPETAKSAGAEVSLQPDECLRISNHDGTPLLELQGSVSGPMVRLLSDDVHLQARGALRLSGKSVSLQAEQGEATIEASADVVVQGENIQLN